MSGFFRNVGVAAAAAGIAWTTLVAPAVAVDPVAGARYQGRVIRDWPEPTVVKLKVSRNRNWVTGVYVGPYPVNTCGAGGDPPDQSASKAAVTNGSFTAHVTYRDDRDRLLAKATVKGTFAKHGREKGTVKTTVVDNAQCSSTYQYTTTKQ